MIKLPRAEFARGLRLAASIAEKASKGASSGNPMLATALLRAKGKTLSIAATDLVVSLTAELACEVESPMTLVLLAEDLRRYVAGASGDEVSLQVDKDRWCTIKCGRSKHRMAGFADRDFPTMPKPSADAIECDAAVLHDVLSRASYAVSNDETRGAIGGVMLRVEGDHYAFTTTDGHRLVTIQRKGQLPRRKNGQATLAARGARELVRLLDGATKCTASIDAKHMHVTVDGITVSTAMLNADQPPFEHVIPKEHKACATVNRDRLIESIRLVSPLASDMRGIKFASRPDALLLCTSDKDGQEITDEVTAEIKGEISIEINAKYMLECLQHLIGDTVEMRTLGELDPIVFVDPADPGCTGLAMPMRKS